MSGRKGIVLCCAFFLMVPALLSSPAGGSSTSVWTNDTHADASHLIRGVPYVSQETDFFCYFASETMIAQFYGLNTTLPEVLYYSGIGYSLGHAPPFLYIVYGGYTLSQAPADAEFLASCYGLSARRWVPANSSSPEAWDDYWTLVKENITQDTPVLTSVNPYALPSIRGQFDVPAIAWFGMRGGHAIVVVGYNDSNRTVCYNDPAAALFGNAAAGTYAWMSYDEFQTAVMQTIGKPEIIITFTKSSEPPSPEVAFANAHARNIEKLKGDRDAYDKVWSISGFIQLGINASMALRANLSTHQVLVFLTYKSDGMRTQRQFRREHFKSMLLRIPASFFTKFHPGEDVFGMIDIEKRYAAAYLANVSNASQYSVERGLLYQEAQGWSNVSKGYARFLNKGVFMNVLSGLMVLVQMKKSLDAVILLEQQLAASP